MTRPPADRFAGCLLGQALGDALGFPVEGHRPTVCRPYADGLLEGRWGVRLPLPRGQYTDDTQLARELLDSTLALGAFSPALYAERIAAQFTEGRIVGRGQATTQAALRIARGVPWQESGAPPPSAGNGSAMRAAPVALIARSDDELVQIAVEQGHITHQDPRCAAGSVAIAAAAAQALRGPLDVDALSVKVAAFDADFGAWVRRLPALAAQPPDVALPQIRRAGLAEGYVDEWDGTVSPFVVGSVLWSLYAAMRCPTDYVGAIRLAILPGGDVDTTAAMTGAVVGARVGLSGLPGWVLHVNDRGRWDFWALKSLAEKAWARRA